MEETANNLPAAEVLLVDDNPADSELVREILGRNTCPDHIHAVLNGTEAIAFLRGQGQHARAVLPDLVILDLNLPGKSGRTVLAEVKADPVLRKIPVVVFSTSNATHDIVLSYETGANCYVSKPRNLRDYVAAVNSIGEYWLGFARLPREGKHE